MRVKLTDRFAKQAAPRGRRSPIFMDEEVIGFGLQDRETGRKSFTLDYIFEGWRRRLYIGDFPDWSTQAAREHAKLIKREIDQGIDPLAVRNERRTAPKHPIVAHDSDAAEPRVLRQIEPVLECFRVSPCLPGREKDEIARRQKRIENIPCDQSACIGIKAKVLGAVSSVLRFSPFSGLLSRRSGLPSLRRLRFHRASALGACNLQECGYPA